MKTKQFKGYRNTGETRRAASEQNPDGEFNFLDPEIERAHREGGSRNGKPGHLLVKMLRHQDKGNILTSQRTQHEVLDFCTGDDLTKVDLEENRKYSDEVRNSFGTGIRSHFAAGKWLDRMGNLVPFYVTNQPGRTREVEIYQVETV
ncbi:hypothetical protein HOLleu_25644 [Holothuria leucospilota]|uniref:Uncharacterized protein n=1 Tax=Holothuria leucospilota TaxID=206669 RepID=A0A9Q1H3M4_HOLLE|nr:hypothetical protein HOLleu_25644 [Holothuria leucospilota]